MSHRVFCCIEGCQRSSSAETCIKRWGTADIRFVCGSHWRRATKREKAVGFRLRRMQKRIKDMTGEEDSALLQRQYRVWGAIERRLAERPPVEPR